VEVAFSDTGSGIPEKYRTKIFTPFFTTKESGTGLGVYLVKETVEAHNGSVTVESREGEGTVFRIFFPLSTGWQSTDDHDEE
jgi:signal transduction histidine kinase